MLWKISFIIIVRKSYFCSPINVFCKAFFKFIVKFEFFNKFKVRSKFGMTNPWVFGSFGTFYYSKSHDFYRKKNLHIKSKIACFDLMCLLDQITCLTSAHSSKPFLSLTGKVNISVQVSKMSLSAAGLGWKTSVSQCSTITNYHNMIIKCSWKQFRSVLLKSHGSSVCIQWNVVTHTIETQLIEKGFMIPRWAMAIQFKWKQ